MALTNGLVGQDIEKYSPISLTESIWSLDNVFFFNFAHVPIIIIIKAWASIDNLILKLSRLK